jgi:hypothetical protein
VKKKHEKKSILKQRRKNYEEYILKPQLEAKKKQEQLEAQNKRTDGHRSEDGFRTKKKQKTSHS